MEKANGVVKCDKTENINYFGNNGLVIINHTKSTDENYTIVIVNENYTVNDVNQRMSFREFRNLILSRTGIIVMVIVLLFVIAITVISSITAKTIVEPIKKIAKGADEIAKGNLDYSIDYESTNELGQTVDSFNGMRLRLKESIEKQAKAIGKVGTAGACCGHCPRFKNSADICQGLCRGHFGRNCRHSRKKRKLY